jgi:hypothetical protein
VKGCGLERGILIDWLLRLLVLQHYKIICFFELICEKSQVLVIFWRSANNSESVRGRAHAPGMNRLEVCGRLVAHRSHSDSKWGNVFGVPTVSRVV